MQRGLSVISHQQSLRVRLLTKIVYLYKAMETFLNKYIRKNKQKHYQNE